MDSGTKPISTRVSPPIRSPNLEPILCVKLVYVRSCRKLYLDDTADGSWIGDIGPGCIAATVLHEVQNGCDKVDILARAAAPIFIQVRDRGIRCHIFILLL